MDANDDNHIYIYNVIVRMLAEVLLVVAVSVVSLALFLLTKDPEEREKDGGIGGGLKPARWSRLRIFKDGEDKAKKTRTVTVSKDTIYAMMQRDVYALNAEDVMTDDEGRPIDDGDDGRWAREQMERVAADLDSDHPNVISLNLLVKDYCDRVEMMMDDFKVGADCRYEIWLYLIVLGFRAEL